MLNTINTELIVNTVILNKEFEAVYVTNNNLTGFLKYAYGIEEYSVEERIGVGLSNLGELSSLGVLIRYNTPVYYYGKEVLIPANKYIGLDCWYVNYNGTWTSMKDADFRKMYKIVRGDVIKGNVVKDSIVKGNIANGKMTGDNINNGN